jgi:menaquinone-dependent protoporphyrinogen IX oxidase
METQFERFLGTKGIVLYKSKYSATKRYAEMLVSAVPFDFMDISKVNVRDLINYDVIVYGGGIYASGIAGLGFLKKNMENLSGKRIILFCVGASPYSKKAYDEIRNKNLTGALSNVPLYYCRGAWDRDKMTFVDRNLCKMLYKAVSKKNPSKYEVWGDALMEAYHSKDDWVDEKYLQPVVNEITQYLLEKQG